MSDNTTRFALPELSAAQAQKHITHNDALIQLDALVDLCLLGQFVNTPPSSPADGDAYLLGGAPTGAWSGYAYKIASCIDGAWRFYAPFNGLRAYVATSSAFLVYSDGVWTDWNSLISAAETSVASAVTCDLGAAGALFVQITGTTAIASFGAAANRLRFVRFGGALTLTHNATSLILRGGKSRVTASGDTGIYVSDSSGNWREWIYSPATYDPPAFSAHNSVLQSVTDSVFTKVTLDVETLDSNNNFAASRFTATVEGCYQFNGTIRCNAVGTMTDFIVTFYKNGAEYFRGYDSLSAAPGTTGSIANVIYLAVGDYVELWGRLGGSASQSFNYSGDAICCSMSGALIRNA